MARRVQLSRKKGWRMPEGCVRCARPGKYGNPFYIGGYFRMDDPDRLAPFGSFAYTEALYGPQAGYTRIRDNAQAVEWFRRYVSGWSPERRARVVMELGGKDLACWCKPSDPCHVDVLLEVANPHNDPSPSPQVRNDVLVGEEALIKATENGE